MNKVIIAGGRDFNDYDMLKFRIGILGINIDEIVSGGAKGADSLGEQFAKEKSIKVIKFPADWVKHKKGAGFIRNVEMAEYANILIAFWDGKSSGTKHMIDTATKLGLQVHIIYY